VPEVITRFVRSPGAVDVSDGCADPVTDACASDHRVAMALVGFPDDEVPLAPPATETACRAQIDLATAMATAAQLEKAGRPVPLSDELPEKYKRAGLEAVAREVVRTCPELGLTFVRMDCDDYPCMALFTGRAKSTPTLCPAWHDVYGGSTINSGGTLVDAEGERFWYSLIGSGPPEGTPGVPPSDIDPDEPFAEHPWMRRVKTRGETARDEVMAATGARELTDAEKRDDQRAGWRRLSASGNEGAAKMLEMMEAKWADEDEVED
jgi:hypothetical protein